MHNYIYILPASLAFKLKLLYIYIVPIAYSLTVPSNSIPTFPPDQTLPIRRLPTCQHPPKRKESKFPPRNHQNENPNPIVNHTLPRSFALPEIIGVFFSKFLWGRGMLKYHRNSLVLFCLVGEKFMWIFGCYHVVGI